MVVMECGVCKKGVWSIELGYGSPELGSIWASSCCYGGSYIMLPLFLVRITRENENYMQVKMPFKSR